MITIRAAARSMIVGMEVYIPPFTASDGSSGAKCSKKPHARQPRKVSWREGARNRRGRK